ncbi:Crp/Fnr family transcriptional regulator [Pseudomarimonas salicorniae]|uniref:CRP-like protein Clp n=1 Tax=Pseudomarimonas salicorniae TaxID=2933270 RepID=A0ABT0GET7_9GAMM|nr:Crp/Fnr family transcriptional regulator [Lysobacter sp. CAU 1642]MCK7593062.1 Crp/Fnr family transcriptional regulator [Lysobacter sp. CAU 1642]
MSALERVPANRLLQALSPSLRSLLPHDNRLDLCFGEVLAEAGAPVTHVYFPFEGCISLLVPISRHPPLELGLIGCEGALGATSLLDHDTSPWRAVVQGEGSALRLTLKQFRALHRRSPGWQRVLRRYVYLQLQQQSRITACSHYHHLVARLARWLLMIQDRTARSELTLSHKFLADMLGVQRPAVTLAAGQLQHAGLIRYARGSIRVLDRGRLLAQACSCYQTLLDDDAAVFPAQANR